MSAEAPGQEEASCHPKVDHVFQTGSGEFEGLLDVLFSKLWMLAEEYFTVRIERHGFHDTNKAAPGNRNRNGASNKDHRCVSGFVGALRS